MNSLNNNQKEDHWFFYWKTSASLWKSKIEELCTGPRVLVPIHWAFHTENGEQFDFSEKKPETDLHLLAQRVAEIGKELVFLLPLGPAPFLTNCGVPHFLARNVSKDLNSLNKFVIDAEGNVNKIFSFFDPRIFKAYSRFVHYLGEYFKEKKLNNRVFGIQSSYIKNKKLNLYIEDHSSIFINAFSRYLENEKVNQERENIEQHDFLSPLLKEKKLRNEFTHTIEDFYRDEASRCMGRNWEGELNFCFLGGAPQDFFYKFSSQEEVSSYSKTLFDSLLVDAIPSTLLLSESVKKDVLQRQYMDIVGETYLPMHLAKDLYHDEEGSLFKDMYFFEVYRNLLREDHSWGDLGIYEFLDEYYPRIYKIKDFQNFKFLDEDDHQIIKFIQGKDLDLKRFNQLLKIFLMGGKIVLDKDGLDPELDKKLESFLLENSIQTQRAKSHTEISFSKLGMGGLLCFYGEKIEDLASAQRNELWLRMISMFEKDHVKINRDPKVEFYWRSRGATTNELSYEEIRRLNVYNPSSYKQKCQVKLESKFALIRVSKEDHSQVQTGPSEINIELLPGSCLAIDLGLFE